VLYKASLVCEGGSMRGVYTAGILDVFMTRDLVLTNAIGVSAGSCNAICYASHQIGRTVGCMAIKDKQYAYMGTESLIRRHKFYDSDFCFQGLDESYYPFDYEAYGKSPVHVEIVATDCATGRADYIHGKAEDKHVMRVSQASATLPMLCDPFPLDGKVYVDGGVSVSIPIDRAMTYGNDKIIVILTQPEGYRKKPVSRLNRLRIKRAFPDYPELRQTLYNRYKEYNKELRKVEALEKAGKIFVFRPSLAINGYNTHYDYLRKSYDMGVADAKKRYDALVEYLEA